MVTLNINGNLEYCFSQRNETLQVRVLASGSDLPTRGYLQIEDTSGQVYFRRDLELTGATLFDTTMALDTGERDIFVNVYTQGGAATHASNIVRTSVPWSGEYSPRFGIHDKVMSILDYNDAFFRSLPTILGETSPQLITCPPNQSTTDNNRFFYVAWPKRLKYGYFQETVQGWSGSWDGAQEFDDFNFVGAAEVTLGGFPYVVYRNDFPFDNLNYVFRIKYGSDSPMSADPV